MCLNNMRKFNFRSICLSFFHLSRSCRPDKYFLSKIHFRIFKNICTSYYFYKNISLYTYTIYSILFASKHATIRYTYMCEAFREKFQTLFSSAWKTNPFFFIKKILGTWNYIIRNIFIYRWRMTSQCNLANICIPTKQ